MNNCVEILTKYGINIIGEVLIKDEKSYIIKYPLRIAGYSNVPKDTFSFVTLPLLLLSKNNTCTIPVHDILSIEDLDEEAKNKYFNLLDSCKPKN